MRAFGALVRRQRPSARAVAGRLAGGLAGLLLVLGLVWQPLPPAESAVSAATGADRSARPAPLAAAGSTIGKKARLEIVSPRRHKTVNGPTLEVEWAARGVVIVPASQATRREDVHVHVLLDRDPAPYLGTNLPIPLGDPQIVHTANPIVNFQNVASGEHHLDLILAYADHVAVNPPVTASLSFTVDGGAAAMPTPTATPTSTASSVEATIASFVYLPDPIVVPVGGSVRWTNLDDAEHTVTADDHAWTSPVLKLNGTFTRTFTQPGTFSYFCEPHPFMRADIVVQ